MSGKRISPLDDPPNVSSSEEEEEEEEEEVGSSSSEDEEEEFMKKTETAPAIMEKQQKEVSDTESATSEYETDTEPEPEKEDPVKKPETKKKRPMETDGEEEEETAKKKAKNVVSGGEEEKKKYFPRVWSEEDEIAVLKGFLDYETETGKNPFVDTSGFYQLTKKNVSFDVKRIQWNEKVRKLKKKFDTNLGKRKKGQDPTFVKSHDRKLFDLSKLIWGVNGIAPESTFTSSSKKTNVSNSNKKLELLNNNNKGEMLDPVAKSVLVKSLGLDDLAVQQGWNKLGSNDKKIFEEQWRALQVKEFEFYSQKSGFIQQLVTKMAENL